MKSAIVNISEITDKEKNPTLCISPLRYTDNCYKCRIYKQEIRRKPLDKIKCKPIVSNEVKRLPEQKRELLDKLAEVNKELGDK